MSTQRQLAVKKNWNVQNIDMARGKSGKRRYCMEKRAGKNLSSIFMVIILLAVMLAVATAAVAAKDDGTAPPITMFSQ